jgi:hypothetical protein
MIYFRLTIVNEPTAKSLDYGGLAKHREQKAGLHGSDRAFDSEDRVS